MGTAGCSPQVGGVLDTQRGCEEANPSPGEMPGCACCCAASRVLCTTSAAKVIIAEPPMFCPRSAAASKSQLGAVQTLSALVTTA